MVGRWPSVLSRVGPPMPDDETITSGAGSRVPGGVGSSVPNAVIDGPQALYPGSPPPGNSDGVPRGPSPCIRTGRSFAVIGGGTG